jgi:hypothetical protein
MLQSVGTRRSLYTELCRIHRRDESDDEDDANDTQQRAQPLPWRPLSIKAFATSRRVEHGAAPPSYQEYRRYMTLISLVILSLDPTGPPTQER